MTTKASVLGAFVVVFVAFLEISLPIKIFSSFIFPEALFLEVVVIFSPKNP
jgi:hypothetical protein